MKPKTKKRCQRKAISSDQLALRELRLELNMTLKDAGKKLALSSKGIGAIENGRVYLDRKRIESIVNSYGLRYLDFIRVKKSIDKEGIKRAPRKIVRSVLSNDDRRSYQRIITKECKVLRSMRRMKGISQDDASKLCGQSRASIGHIENGRIELSKERIKHIVESYGYSFKNFQEEMEKEQQRSEILDLCLEKIRDLDDSKLDLVFKLVESL